MTVLRGDNPTAMGVDDMTLLGLPCARRAWTLEGLLSYLNDFARSGLARGLSV